MSRFKVTGLSCNGCVNRLTNVIKELDPKANVSVDLPTGILVIENSSVGSTDIIAKIEISGYGATPA